MDTLANAIDTMNEECIATRIRLLNRTVTGIFDEALRPLGIKVSQLNVLLTVAKLGPVSPGDVARHLNLEKSTVSRNIDRMRAHKWFTVCDIGCGCMQELELAAPGRKLIKDALPLWEKAQSRTEDVLGKRGARAIHSAGNTVWAQLDGL